MKIYVNNRETNVNLSKYALKEDLHYHNNKSVLDQINESKINQWDNALNQISELLNMIESLDKRIKALESNAPGDNIPCTGITLNQNRLELNELNKTYRLIATVEPSNTTDMITWKSSSDAVASVFNGVVTPKANGECIITATCGSKSATCNVTINNMKITAKQGYVSVNTNMGDYELNMKDYFVFTNVNADSVTWTIEKTSGDIGTLNSSGMLSIAFQTEAAAKVTATYNGISASITVQAVRAAIVCTGISLNKISLSFTSLNTTQLLIATLTPSNTTDTVSWRSSDTTVATVNNSGVVTSKANGTCTITATCGGKTTTCTVVVDVNDDIIVTQASVTVNTSPGVVILDMKEYFKLNNINIDFNDVTWNLINTSGELGNIANEGILTIPYRNVATGVVTASHGNSIASIIVNAVNGR